MCCQPDAASTMLLGISLAMACQVKLAALLLSVTMMLASFEQLGTLLPGVRQ